MLASMPKIPTEDRRLNVQHLLNITDDTGIFQHCRYAIPNREHGYTLDDNARALIVAACSPQSALVERLPTYLSFVLHCQRSDGLFHNFMSFDRHFLDEVGSFDAHGRTLWALGVLYQTQPRYQKLAEEMLLDLITHLDWQQIPHLRPKAFVILGLLAYLQANPTPPNQCRQLLEKLAEDLLRSWQQTTSQNQTWQWFEHFLSYENARLPQALFAAYLYTGQHKYLTIAKQTTAFLEKIHFDQDYLKLVGNRGWYYPEEGPEARADFDEQPVDAGALVEMFNWAYQATYEMHYLELGQLAFSWYGGRNCHGLALIDPQNGACYDGLTVSGVNLNQGSESTLSYQMALQSLASQPESII
jgi:hypothetical protein